MNAAIKAVIAASFLISVFQVSDAYFYHKENRFAPFLKKYASITHPPSVSGLNIKVTEESMTNLVDTFLHEFGEVGDFDRALFEFEGDEEFDGFDDIDLSDSQEPFDKPEEPLSKSGESSAISEGKEVQTSYGKWACVYSRVFAIGNGTKSFLKLHQTVKEGGSINSEVDGSLDKGVHTLSSGNVDGAVNITIFSKGKQQKYNVKAHSTVRTNETDVLIGKKIKRYLAGSKGSVNSKITVGSKTMNQDVSFNSGSETLIAPFHTFLTLFETEFQVTVDSVQVQGTTSGEVASRIVYAKGKKSLIRVVTRGYVMVEGKDVCSVKMFKVKSHVWTKPAAGSSMEDSEDYEQVNDDTEVDVGIYSKGRIYERTSAANKINVFAGSGAVMYEKAKVSVPKGVSAHQHGVHAFVRHIVNGNWNTLFGLSQSHMV